jgi:signal transduction histidine kinase
MVRIRWYYILLMSLIAIGPTFALTNDMALIGRYSALGVFGVICNGLLHLSLAYKPDKAWYHTGHAFLQIILDALLASMVVYVLGGLQSRATILYALPILTSGILFLGLYAYLAAILSAASYTATLFLYLAQHPGAYEASDIIVPAAFYSCIFIIIARIVAYFSAINASAERESSYSQLLAMLRHQLRHPSSAIAALIDSLEHQKAYNDLPPEAVELVRQVKRENISLNSMISNLLLAATPHEGTDKKAWNTVDLASLLHETATSCATGAQRLGDLHETYEEGIPGVEGQPAQLKMAFNNIIDNAFKYSEPGSAVNVTLQDAGTDARIIIEDNGPGLSAGQRKQLFKRFTSFESNQAARQPYDRVFTSGLGLYVSKLIIERHGSRLDLTSKPGQGTKLTILLKKDPST